MRNREVHQVSKGGKPVSKKMIKQLPKSLKSVYGY
jgi:hypothetical protein